MGSKSAIKLVFTIITTCLMFFSIDVFSTPSVGDTLPPRIIGVPQVTYCQEVGQGIVFKVIETEEEIETTAGSDFGRRSNVVYTQPSTTPKLTIIENKMMLTDGDKVERIVLTICSRIGEFGDHAIYVKSAYLSKPHGLIVVYKYNDTMHAIAIDNVKNDNKNVVFSADRHSVVGDVPGIWRDCDASIEEDEFAGLQVKLVEKSDRYSTNRGKPEEFTFPINIAGNLDEQKKSIQRSEEIVKAILANGIEPEAGASLRNLKIPTNIETAQDHKTSKTLPSGDSLSKDEQFSIIAKHVSPDGCLILVISTNCGVRAMIIPSYTNVSRNEFNAKHMLLIDQSVAKNISVKHVDFSEISSKTIMVIRGHIGINNDQKPISITFEMLANGCIERVK